MMTMVMIMMTPMVMTNPMECVSLMTESGSSRRRPLTPYHNCWCHILMKKKERQIYWESDWWARSIAMVMIILIGVGGLSKSLYGHCPFESGFFKKRLTLPPRFPVELSWDGKKEGYLWSGVVKTFHLFRIIDTPLKPPLLLRKLVIRRWLERLSWLDAGS